MHEISPNKINCDCTEAISVCLFADLEAETAAIEAGFVHGAVLLHKLAAQILHGVQLPTFVVVEQLLGEVEQGAQLAQSAAVRLHLRDIVVRPEEGTVVV